jgi:hypothetical protein
VVGAASSPRSGVAVNRGEAPSNSSAVKPISFPVIPAQPRPATVPVLAIGLPAFALEAPASLELTPRPIYVEPLVEADSEWREWQLARQRAARKSRQAERENLTGTLQRLLQDGARVPP